jgi:hypothetical protein
MGIILRTQKIAAGHAAAAFHKHGISFLLPAMRKNSEGTWACKDRDARQTSVSSPVAWKLSGVAAPIASL